MDMKRWENRELKKKLPRQMRALHVSHVNKNELNANIQHSSASFLKREESKKQETL